MRNSTTQPSDQPVVDVPSTPSHGATRGRFALVWPVLRIAVTAAVFVFLLSRVDSEALRDSFARVPRSAVVWCVVMLFVAAGTGVLRWRLLLSAYGARELPSLAASTRIYLVSMFYNLLPGGIGGDIVRGYGSRHAFEGGSVTPGLMVVFVERVLGVSGLLVLSATTTLLMPRSDAQVLLYSALGLAAALASVVGLVCASRLARFVPGRVGRMLAELPRLAHPGQFGLALAASVLTHILIALGGHAVIGALTAQVSVVDSLVVFPLGTLAAYFPLTVAGAGARDTALVVLFGQLGIARADALAASLSMLVCQVVVSSTGGLFALGRPVALPKAETEPQ